MKTGNDTKMIKRDQNVYSIMTANDRKNFLTRLTRSRIFKEVRKEFKWVKNRFMVSIFCLVEYTKIFDLSLVGLGAKL